MLQVILTTVLIGIILAVLTSILWNVAPIIQKEALGDMEEIEASQALKHTKELFTNKRWTAGFALATFGGLFYIFATDMAGIVVVQPLMNVGLVALAILATKRLGEVIDTSAVIGIILLIFMPVFIAFGGVTEPMMFTTFDNLIMYCVIVLGATIAMVPLTKKFPILWSPISAFLQGLAAQFVQWFTLALFSVSDPVQGFINAFIPLVLMGVFTFIAGVYTISIGLQQNPAARFNSITGTISMFVVVIGGVLIYGQFITNLIFYGIGFVFGIIGIALLSKYQE